MPDPKFEIWDVHTHLVNVPGETPEARVETLIAGADRLGISRVVLFVGLNGETYDLSPAEIRQANDEALRAMRVFPKRVFGFVYLNPKNGAACLDELDRCVRDGPMIGVKLLAAEHCNAPTLDPIVERATGLGVPVLQHTWLKITGNLPGESTPMELAELAARHPDAVFMCAHCGGDWERGLRAIRPHARVYADLCGGDPTSGFTEMAVRELGAGRCLFGSDFGSRGFASQLGKVLGADISDADKRLVLGENLKRLLRPILRKKGIEA